MLEDDIEMVGLFVEQCAGRDSYREAWHRIKTALAELGATPNTGKPEMLTLEEVRNGIVESGMCSKYGLDMNNVGKGIKLCYDYMCRHIGRVA